MNEKRFGLSGLREGSTIRVRCSEKVPLLEEKGARRVRCSGAILRRSSAPAAMPPLGEDIVESAGVGRRV